MASSNAAEQVLLVDGVLMTERDSIDFSDKDSSTAAQRHGEVLAGLLASLGPLV